GVKLSRGLDGGTGCEAAWGGVLPLPRRQSSSGPGPALCRLRSLSFSSKLRVVGQAGLIAKYAASDRYGSAYMASLSDYRVAHVGGGSNAWPTADHRILDSCPLFHLAIPAYNRIDGLSPRFDRARRVHHRNLVDLRIGIKFVAAIPQRLAEQPDLAGKHVHVSL